MQLEQVKSHFKIGPITADEPPRHKPETLRSGEAGTIESSLEKVSP